MRILIIAGLLLAACGRSADAPSNNVQPPAAAEGWTLQISGDEPALVLAAGGAAEIRILCRPGQQLLVNVPGFEPIGSEERLSFGQGDDVVALVADVRGDGARGGVSGEGALPGNLVELLSGRVSAAYGAQTSGPHPPPPPPLVEAFVNACSGSAPGAGETSPAAGASACLRTPGGEPVPPNSIKAIGTEPFWAAEIHGRCVTYSTPEDIDGTRVWTKFSGTAEHGTWSGALDGRLFELRTTPEPGCSDGMSDKRYPIAATLTVRGEQRRGCAEPR